MTTDRDRFSVQSLAERLPGLLDERGLSLRGLAERIDITHSHLSRAVRSADGKMVSGELARRIAVALDLPADYFPETREAAVIEQIRSNPVLRDRLYRQLAQRQ